jgi:RimJ/RimL family protein N-acetyltransferase
MTTDARNYRAEDTLRNGIVITIRAVRSDDRERLSNAFAKLERESVYTRFFTYKKALSATELGHIDTMDFVRDVMLVVTTRPDGDEIVIASARYVANDTDEEGVSAEVAFTVEEDYQGLGIAGRMLAHLIAIARQGGIARFVADVLPGNKAMLAVFARAGLPLHKRIESGVVNVEIDLLPTAPDRSAQV